MADDSPEARALKMVTIKAVLRIQGQFEGRIIRRTLDSKDCEGKTLLNLPLCKQIHGILTLTDREQQIIEALAQQAKDRLVVAPLYIIRLTLI